MAIWGHNTATALCPGYGSVSRRIARVHRASDVSNRSRPSAEHLHDLRLETRPVEGSQRKFGTLLQDPAHWT